MAEHTNISWCDSTFNPWIGCTRVSPGCDNCYAAVSTPTRAMRIGWGNDQPRHRTAVSNWKAPLLWEKHHEAFQLAHGRRRRVFCASLGDVFDNQVPHSWRVDLWATIHATPHLDWLLLTKRIGNVSAWTRGAGDAAWPANVWLGASIVNQEEADRDIPKLLQVPARVRFLSMEPLLSPVTVPGFNAHTAWCPRCAAIVLDSLMEQHEQTHGRMNMREPFDPRRNCSSVYDQLHWVVVGGESGPKARPMQADWARSLRDQCGAAGVPFFFKQWGGSTPTAGGDYLDGVQYHAWPKGGA